MRIRRLATVLTLLGLLLGGLLPLMPRPAAAQAEACFAETGFCVRGRFLDYWERNGGLGRNGFPISEERRELLEDGNQYTVQYFERVRLELHPENAPPYDVLLGQFGRRVARTGSRTQPTAPIAGRVYFPETGHSVSPRFFAYWQANGGLAQFGYPLGDEYEQALEGGRYTVQYFERARFELHPENAALYDILLGQFGRRILAENDALARNPDFHLLYLTDQAVQEWLGLVVGLPNTAPGSYQRFEQGLMLYEGGAGQRIYVFCRGEQSGRALGPTLDTAFFPDTYGPGEPVGGGLGPGPGLYEPRLGFGKLWRENSPIRNCLSYATTPEEIAYTIRRQGFSAGNLLSLPPSVGPFIYVEYASSGGYLYERYPDPTP